MGVGPLALLCVVGIPDGLDVMELRTHRFNNFTVVNTLFHDLAQAIAEIHDPKIVSFTIFHKVFSRGAYG